MTTADLAPVNLRCEYLVEPLAIERPDPRLSWHSDSAVRGAVQSAWRIRVAANAADLAAGRNLLWDSGKTSGAESAHIAYAGPKLSSFQRVHWQVQVWDGADRASAWSAPASWAMGVLAPADWQGHWLSFAVTSTNNSPYYRRTFTVAKPVVDARLYGTARGLFLASIDGVAVSDDVFAPGWTDYRQRQPYRCWDVTARFAAPGDHAIGALLNDGWFRGPIGWSQHCAIWGSTTELLLMLRLVHVDGSVTVIATDGDWRTSASPVINSTFMRGETYDAGLAIRNWDRAGFDDRKWYRANTRARDGKIPLQSHAGPPVRRLLELKPVAKWQPRPGAWIFDFAQNFAGRARIRIDAPAGTTIRLRHAEILTPERELYTDNLRAAISIDTYTCAGGGETWEPLFTFHGFQYVEISGWPGEPPLDAITGVVLGSDCPSAGSFACSSPLINQLYSNLVWTQRANFIEVPTDCPQRDERLGWTGDAQAFIRTAICNNDVAAFFTKWLLDLRDAQTADGAFPNVAPMVPNLLPDRGDAGWGDAGVICPWALWNCYGDRDQLATMYPHMLRWIDYLDRTGVEGVHIRAARDGLCMFGDWLAVDSWTPGEVVMTAFFAHAARITADAAEVLGKADDVKRLRGLHAKITAAFARAFVKPDGRVIGWRSESDTQTGYVLALHFDLIPAELRAAATGHLVGLIEKCGWHLSTGFLGLPYLLPVLCRFGREDIAFRLLMTDTYPSWGYPITQGATTIWERWNGWTKEHGPADPSMNSYSHYAYGAVGEWLFSDLAGIDLAAPGFAAIRIRPRIGGGITHARAEHTCMRGRIASAWRIDGDRLHLDVTIPANTRATIHIPTSDPSSLRENDAPWPTVPATDDPGHARVEVGAGSYSFTARRS